MIKLVLFRIVSVIYYDWYVGTRKYDLIIEDNLFKKQDEMVTQDET